MEETEVLPREHDQMVWLSSKQLEDKLLAKE